MPMTAANHVTIQLQFVPCYCAFVVEKSSGTNGKASSGIARLNVAGFWVLEDVCMQ
jgi:hypothetical protein